MKIPAVNNLLTLFRALLLALAMASPTAGLHAQPPKSGAGDARSTQEKLDKTSSALESAGQAEALESIPEAPAPAAADTEFPAETNDPLPVDPSGSVPGRQPLPAPPQPAAPPEPPVYEQDPYDIIRIADQGARVINGMAEEGTDTGLLYELKVMLLPLAGRRIPKETARLRPLKFQLVDDLETEYEVDWRYVAGWKDKQGKIYSRIEFFEDRVLNKAAELVQQNRLNDAYNYFDFLSRLRFKPEDYTARLAEFLLASLKEAKANNDWEKAYLLLNQLKLLDPADAELPGELVNQELADAMAHLSTTAEEAGAFRQARLFIQRSPRIGEQFYPAIASAQSQLREPALQALRLAEQALSKQEFLQADSQIQIALARWPDHPTARDFASRLHQQFPVLHVGVTSAGVFSPLDAWSADRYQPLLQPQLFELVKQTPDGGEYQAQGILWEPASAGPASIRITLKPELQTSLSGLELSDVLLARQPPAMVSAAGSSGEKPGWHLASLQKVNSPTSDGLELLLKSPLLPPAQLRVPIDPNSAWGHKVTPFVSQTRPHYWMGSIRSDYAWATSAKTKGIQETEFRTRNAALSALRYGEVSAVDRLHPADVRYALNQKNLVVRQYSLPRIHLIVTNPARPMLRQRSFRRGLEYALHRESIFQFDVIGNRELSGWKLVSGLFPVGRSVDDPVAYASSTALTRRAYDLRLGQTLLQLGARQSMPADEKASVVKKIVLPDLVLVHPHDDFIRGICNRMVEMWSAAGVQVRLQSVRAGEPIPDYDLLYLDAAAWEPLVDAERLLRGQSPYVDLLLNQLAAAENWADARELLREIQVQSQQEALYIPLWQVYEYYALDRRLADVSAERKSLYDGVLDWSAPLTTPAE